MKKNLPFLLTAFGFFGLPALMTAAYADSLPSWNDGPAKKSIIRVFAAG